MIFVLSLSCLTLIKAGWDIERQVREEVFFTDGRILQEIVGAFEPAGMETE